MEVLTAVSVCASSSGFRWAAWLTWYIRWDVLAWGRKEGTGESSAVGWEIEPSFWCWGSPTSGAACGGAGCKVGSHAELPLPSQLVNCISFTTNSLFYQQWNVSLTTVYSSFPWRVLNKTSGNILSCPGTHRCPHAGPGSRASSSPGLVALPGLTAGPGRWTQAAE